MGTKEERLKWVFSKPTYVIYCTPKRYVLTTKQLCLICFGRVCVHTQVCWTFYNPMDCNLPQSSVHRIFQTRILEWVVISYSRGIFPTQGWNLCLLCLLQWQADFVLLTAPPGKPLWEDTTMQYICYVCMNIYIYIYMCVCVCVCVCVFVCTLTTIYFFYLKEGHMFSKTFSSLYV